MTKKLIDTFESQLSMDIETKSNESGMSKGEMIRSLLEKSIDLDKINNNKVLS